MWKEYNPNPCGRAVGDCAVRAITKALGVDWEIAYLMIAANGYSMCDMPSSNSVWGALLRRNGFYRKSLDEPITFGEFADTFNEGVYVLGTGTHTATIIDGVLYDAWDSSNEYIDFIWYRKED